MKSYAVRISRTYIGEIKKLAKKNKRTLKGQLEHILQSAITGDIVAIDPVKTTCPTEWPSK